jgi:hypothetical protein
MNYLAIFTLLFVIFLYASAEAPAEPKIFVAEEGTDADPVVCFI